MSRQQDQKEDKPILGRPGNNVKMGIVGMPNVGKSTIFNVLSNLNVPAENYPFCTIDPNQSRVPVPDKRFDFLCQFYKPKSEVPAVLGITDIAGLVKGAHEGKGLGNAFLSHIFAVDGIYHLCRAFDSTEIEHVEGSVDPTRDMDIIGSELRFKDLERVNDKIEQLDKIVKRGLDKTNKSKDELVVMTKVKEMLEANKDVRVGDWTAKDIDFLNQMMFLTAKPVVYLVNVSEKDFLRQKNKWFKDIHEWVKKNSPGAPIIPFSAEFEAKVSTMPDDEKQRFCDENKAQSMLSKIITNGYHCLDLIHFFTSGEDEVRAWTIRNGTKAPQAAGVIHTDFEKGFICAETMAFDDFKEHGSESAVKAAGKYKTQGKTYVVQDGDIMYFKFNVTAPPKKK